MSSFDWKKNVEYSIKDGLIMTATTTEIFYVLKAANVKPPKASLDAIDIMKLAGGIVGVSLLRTMESTKYGSTNDITKSFMVLLRAIKLHKAKCRAILRGAPLRCFLLTHVSAGLLFLFLKIPLGSVTLRWANKPSRLNMITSPTFRCFFNLKQYTSFSTVMPLP